MEIAVKPRSNEGDKREHQTGVRKGWYPATGEETAFRRYAEGTRRSMPMSCMDRADIAIPNVIEGVRCVR